MTREFRRINIDPFTPQSAQEYTILELAAAVINARLTFCGTNTERLNVGTDRPRQAPDHGLSCGPREELRASIVSLGNCFQRLDLRVFKEA